MNRRNTLKKLALTTGGLMVLPSWAKGWSVSDLVHQPSTFTTAEQEILASITDTIIPAGDSIGALSVGVDKFLAKLIDKCYEQEVQDNVKAQLNALHKTAQSSFDKPFSACDPLRRQELLLKLSVSEDKAEQDFFNLMKSETIRGFNTSKEVMTSYLNYKVAPGYYHGCADITT